MWRGSLICRVLEINCHLPVVLTGSRRIMIPVWAGGGGGGGDCT